MFLLNVFDASQWSYTSHKTCIKTPSSVWFTSFQFSSTINIQEELSPFLLLKVAVSFTGSSYTTYHACHNIIRSQIVYVGMAWQYSAQAETLLNSVSITRKWQGVEGVVGKAASCTPPNYKRYFPVAILCSSLCQFLCRQCFWFTFYLQANVIGETHGQGHGSYCYGCGHVS